MAVSELPGNPNAVWTVRLNKLGRKCLHGGLETSTVFFIHKGPVVFTKGG